MTPWLFIQDIILLDNDSAKNTKSGDYLKRNTAGLVLYQTSLTIIMSFHFF